MATADGGIDSIEKADVKGSIGAILDYSSRIGKEEKVAMEMAIEEFNSQYSNQHIDLLINDSQGEPIQAALAARELVYRHRVKAILGPQSWEEASLVAEVGSQAYTPILSLAYTTPQWATERWPFLIQASADQSAQMKAIAAVIESQDWHRVTVVYEDIPSSTTGAVLQLSEALKDVGIEIGHLLPLPPLSSSSSLVEELQSLKEGQCRVFVVHTSLQLGVHLFETAKKMEMMKEGYIWIITDTISIQDIPGRFRRKFISEHPDEEKNEPGIYAAKAYDATWAAALAMKGGRGTGQQLLEKISNGQFDGLTGKIQFSDQKLAPAHIFQIINVVGKSDRELGFWSETSEEESGFWRDRRALAQVVWPGGPRNTPRGWTPPTDEKPLNIGVPIGSTFKQFVEVIQDGNNISFKGFSINVFNATVERLPYALPHKLYAFSGTYDELVRQIYLKKFDAVVGDVAIVAKRFEHAEFTQPYAEPGLQMITTVRSKSSNKAWLFMKPFTRAMWILITFINVYNGFVVWLIERNHCNELKGSVLNQIGTLLWLAFSTLFSLHGEKLHSNLSRMAMVVWLFVALVITQSYTANLTSMLTVQQLEPTVADIETLKSSNSMIGYCRGSFVSAYLKDVLAAAFLEAPFAKLFLAKYCKSFMAAGPSYKVGGFGFVFPRGSPLLHDVSEALLNVSESGKLRELENSMLSSEKCEDAETEDDETSRLSPSSFWVLFIITGGTSTFSLLFICFIATGPSMILPLNTKPSGDFSLL
ncbi:Glutamate receptor 2.7 [Vitis vinifera]|uniref:Glutamate receptor n=1 Tax=Vitis vinifera TaxID=29760 RepID=A0A438E5N9_VITVI|nr:Glutamate receptor 2.7 [Vitis vinifera]